VLRRKQRQKRPIPAYSGLFRLRDPKPRQIRGLKDACCRSPGKRQNLPVNGDVRDPDQSRARVARKRACFLWQFRGSDTAGDSGRWGSRNAGTGLTLIGWFWGL